MKKWFLYIFPLMLLSMFVTACKHRIEPDDKGGKTNVLSLNVEIKEGVRLENEIVSYPVVNMTVDSEDDAANYTLSYSIDKRPEKKVSSLWNGKKVSLGGDFKENEGFGRHSIHAKLVNDENVEDYAVIDTCVWIAYRLTEYSGPIFVSAGRAVELQDNAVLYKGEEGYLEFHYSPSNSILPIELELDSNSPINLDESKRQCKNGILSIPAKINGSAETTLTVTLENGVNVESKTYSIICKDDSEGVTLGLELNAAPLSVWNEGLGVSFKIKDMQTRAYDIIFEVDGDIVDALMGANVSGTVEHVVPSTTLSEGEHTLNVVVMDATNHNVSVSKQAKFYHCNATLSIDNKALSLGEAITMEVGHTYTIKCIGVPSSYHNLLNLISSDGRLDINQNGSTGNGWLVTPNKFGKGTLAFSISSGRTNVFNYPVACIEEILVNLTQSENFIYGISLDCKSASNVSFSVSGKAEYAAQCDYMRAVPESAASDKHQNESMTRTDWPGSKSFNLSVSGAQRSITLVDLSERYSYFATQTYQSEIWDEIKQNQKKTVNYPYFLIVTSLNLYIEVPYSVQDRDCVRFKTNVNWNYLHFN